MFAKGAWGDLAREMMLQERPNERDLLVVMTSGERRPDRKRFHFHAPFYWLGVREAEKHIVSPFDGYVITGGETAMEICYAMKGVNFQIFGESEPGIVRAVLNREPGLASVMMILKAGGFGDEGTLARCVGLE
jgi:hypothetical protein